MADTATAAPAAPAAGAAARLEHLPVTVFAVVMGLGGTSLAWQRAARTTGAPQGVGAALAWCAAGVLVVVGATYLAKVVRHRPAVLAEWRHPVKLAFVPTLTISLVIVSAAFAERLPGVSAALFWVGAPAQLLLTLDVLRTWIGDPRFTLEHVHPAWFIPVVGNLVVPLAGTAHADRQVSWFFFSVGLVYWLALLPVVLGRLVVGGALPGRLAPTLAVLVAPPAVAVLSWTRLGGTFTDPLAQVLVDVTLFQLLLLATQASACPTGPDRLHHRPTVHPARNTTHLENPEHPVAHRRFLALPAAAVVLTSALALTGCGSSSGSAGSAVTAVDGVKHLPVDDFASLAGTPGVVVLDVRTPAEFTSGHLPNAVNLDFRAADFADQVKALDPAKTYAVYCHSGNRSGQALEVFQADGFAHVADLEGGITAWASAGKEVVTG